MSSVLILIALALLGVFVGSFLNVFILRYGTGKSFVSGRSFCFSCKQTLSAKDLIPLLSFIALGGRCRYCKTPLSTQYPLVELSNGALFAGIAYLLLPLWQENLLIISLTFIILAGISSLMLSILVYDIRHKIIPDGMALSLAIASGLLLFINIESLSFGIPSLLEVLSAPIVALPLFLMWLLSGGRWMGLGDAKLVWSFGWILGLSGALTAIILGFWIGALVALLIMFLQKTSILQRFRWGILGMKSEIPFAPFLIIGFFLTFFVGINLFGIF